MIDFDAIQHQIVEICMQYRQSAPTVTLWAEDLYSRILERPDDVRLSEILALGRFLEEGSWEHPNFAANRVYHLMHRLGQDTTGHVGF